MKVIFWLVVIPTDGNPNGAGDLWTRIIDTGFLPDPGDWVYTSMDNSDDGDGACSGFRLSPKRRYMDTNGQWHVELQAVVVDPDDVGSPATAVWSPFWTYGDPDALARQEQLLRTSGWVER